MGWAEKRKDYLQNGKSKTSSVVSSSTQSGWAEKRKDYLEKQNTTDTVDWGKVSGDLKKELAMSLGSGNFDKDASRGLVENYAGVQFKIFDENLKKGYTGIKPIGENLSNLFKAHGYDFGELYPDLAESFATGNIEGYAYGASAAFKKKIDDRETTRILSENKAEDADIIKLVRDINDIKSVMPSVSDIAKGVMLDEESMLRWNSRKETESRLNEKLSELNKKLEIRKEVAGEDISKYNDLLNEYTTGQKILRGGKWLGTQLDSGFANASSGIVSTADFLLPTELLGKYDFLSKANDYYKDNASYYSQRASAESEKTGGGGWNTAGEVAQGVAAAIPDMIVAILSGGSSIGAKAGGMLATDAIKGSSAIKTLTNNLVRNPTYWSSAVNTLGRDYEEAKARGASDIEATFTAFLTTALNSAYEVGGVQELPSKLKNGGNSAILDYVKSTLDEGKEEVLQKITSNTVALLYDKEAPLFSLKDETAIINPKALVKDFGMGVAVGGILGAGPAVVNAYAQKSETVKISSDMNDTQRYEVLKDKAISDIPSIKSISAETIAQISRDLSEGKINTWSDINKYHGATKRTLIQKIASAFGVFKEYTNDDINISFEFSKNNFRESYSKQGKDYEDFAKMFSVFDKVIENAVGIEVHNRNNDGYKPDATLENVYVLVGAYKDGEYIIPVKLEVKEFNDKNNSLYVAVSLDKIKETEVWKQGTTKNGVAQNSRSVNISIRDIFKNINTENVNFLKYIPNGFLSDEQISVKSVHMGNKKTGAETDAATENGVKTSVNNESAPISNSISHSSEDVNRLIRDGESSSYIASVTGMSVDEVNNAKSRLFSQSLLRTSMSDFDKANAIKRYTLKEQALDRMYEMGKEGLQFDASMAAGVISDTDAYKAFTRGENAYKARQEADAARIFDEAPTAPEINKEKAATLETESSTSWLEQLKGYDFNTIIRQSNVNVNKKTEVDVIEIGANSDVATETGVKTNVNEKAPINNSISGSSSDVNTVISSMGSEGVGVYKSIMNTVTEGGTNQKTVDSYKAAAAHVYDAGKRGVPYKRSSSQPLRLTQINAIYDAAKKDAARQRSAGRKANARLIRDDIFKKAKISNREGRMLETLAKMTGRDIRFSDELSGNAKINLDTGEIIISTKAKTGVRWAAIHEVFHAMRVDVPAEANKLIRTVLDIVKKNPAAFRSALNLYAGKYSSEIYDSDGNLTPNAADIIEEEMAADMIGFVISNSKVLSTITGEQRNILQRFIDKIKGYFDKFDLSAIAPDARQAYLDVYKEADKIVEEFKAAFEVQKGVVKNSDGRAEKKTSETEAENVKNSVELIKGTSVGLNNGVKTVYNIGKIKETTFPQGSSKAQSAKGAAGTNVVSNNNYTQKNGNVNTSDERNSMDLSGKDENTEASPDLIASLSEKRLKRWGAEVAGTKDNKGEVLAPEVIIKKVEKAFMPSKSVISEFSNSVDKWLSGSLKSSEQFELGETPIVLQKLNAQNLPIKMSQDVLYKITGGKHSISLDEIKRLPEAICDPIMVFDSASVSNSFVIFTELTDKSGNDVVMAIHLNRKAGFNYINRIASVYGKNNIGSFIENQISENNLRYIEKKKSQDWLRSRGLQLPKLNTILNSNNNILQKKDIVNSILFENNEKNSRDLSGNDENTEASPDLIASLSEKRLKRWGAEVAGTKDNKGEVLAPEVIIKKVEKAFMPSKSVITRFSNSVDKWMSGSMKYEEYFSLGNTPATLKSVGANDFPVVMSQDVIVKMTGGKHSISIDEIKRLPEAIYDPIMVFDSATVPNSFVIITELEDKNGNGIVVALHLAKKQKRLFVNRVASVYGKENIGNFIEAQTKLGNLKYINKEKSQQWSTNRGLQLPKLVQSTTDNDSILQKEDIVNSILFENNEKNSRDLSGNDENSEASPDLIASLSEKRLKRWGAEVAGTKDNKGEVLAPEVIIKKVEKAFGVPITKGGTAEMSDKNYVSMLRKHEKTITSKFTGDLPEISHALGYYIDDVLSLTEKISEQNDAAMKKSGEMGILAKELQRILQEDYIDISGKEIQEGFAEFVRLYLMSKETAHRKAPMMTEFFEKAIAEDRTVKAAIESSAKYISDYLGADFAPRLTAMVMNTADADKFTADSLMIKAGKAGKDLYQNYVDRNSGIYNVLKRINKLNLKSGFDPYVMATNLGVTSARSAEILTRNFVNYRGDVVGESLASILKDVGDADSENYKLFNEYLFCRHAPSWLDPHRYEFKGKARRGTYKPIFKDEILNDADSIRQRGAEIEAVHPEFEALAQRVYKYQDNLQKYYIMEAGGISRDQYDEFKLKYPNYVPLMRYDDVAKEYKSGKISLANLPSPLKVATGGSGIIISPMESIMRSTMSAVDFYQKNRIVTSIGDMVTGKDGVHGIMERVYSTKELKELLEEAGEKPNAILQENVLDREYYKKKKKEANQNFKTLVSMESVADLKGDELDGDRPASIRVKALFEKWGNEIDTERFGKVQLTASSIRSELRHGITRNKTTSFAAIPQVLERGVVIDSIRKNNGEVKRVVVAAPITISNTPYFMGVMIQKDSNTNRFYLHDVVIKKEASEYQAEHLNTTGPIDGGNLHMTELLERAVTVSNSISQGDGFVNEQINKRGAEEEFTPVASAKAQILYAWKDGKKAFYKVHDVELYNSLANLSEPQLGLIFRASRRVLNLRKIGITSGNVLFTISNFYRDFMTYRHNTTDLLAMQAFRYVTSLTDIVLANFGVGKNKALYEQFLSLGGSGTSIANTSVDALGKAVRKLQNQNKSVVERGKDIVLDWKHGSFIGHTLKGIVDVFCAINEVIEHIPRFTQFKKEMSKHGDSLKAFYEANDVTTNFSRKGLKSAHANSLFMFFNASVQGLDKARRSYVSAGVSKKEATNRVFRDFTTAMLFFAAMVFFNRDDEAKEAYEMLSEYTKRNYDCFYIGDGKFLKFPKERELAIFRSAWQMFAEYMILEDERTFDSFTEYCGNWFTYAVGNIGLTASAGNTAAGPIIEAWSNKNYRGEDIVPEYLSMSTEYKHERYRDDTSVLSVNLAKFLYDNAGIDISPMSIDHVITGYGGWFGDRAVGLMPQAEISEKGFLGVAKDKLSNPSDFLGFKNRYTADAMYSTDLINNVYEASSQAEIDIKRGKTGKTLLDGEKYIGFESYVSVYNKLSKGKSLGERRNDRYNLQKQIMYRDDSIDSVDEWLIKLYDETGVESIFFDSYPNFKSGSFSVSNNGVKWNVTLDAASYSDFCADIDAERHAVREMVMRLGLEPKQAAYILDKVSGDITTAVKQKWAAAKGVPDYGESKKKKAYNEKKNINLEKSVKEEVKETDKMTEEEFEKALDDIIYGK